MEGRVHEKVRVVTVNVDIRGACQQTRYRGGGTPNPKLHPTQRVGEFIGWQYPVVWHVTIGPAHSPLSGDHVWERESNPMIGDQKELDPFFGRASFGGNERWKDGSPFSRLSSDGA